MSAQPSPPSTAARRRSLAERAALYLALATFAAALGAGLHLATGSLGAPFPGLLVDPFARFSAVLLPSWGAPSPSLRHPDRLVSVDGVALPALPNGRPPARALWDHLAAAPARRSVTLVFTDAMQGTRIEVVRPVRRLGRPEFAFFFALYAAVAALLAYTGGVIARIGQGPAARACVATLFFAALTLTTFYDYHTTMRMTEVFSTAVTGYALSLFWLAYAFPKPPQRWAAPLRAALGLLTAAGVVAAGVLAIAPRLGGDPHRVRMATSLLLPLGGLTLFASIALRLPRATGRERAEILSTLWGITSAPALVGVVLCASLVTGSSLGHLVIPFLFPLLAVSVGLSIAWHDVLDTHFVLTRQLFLFPAVVLAGCVATPLWLALRSDGASGMDSYVPAVFAGLVFVAVAASLHRAIGRSLFPAAIEFRPTIQQLGESLADIGHFDDLRLTLERTIGRWLPSGRVRLRAAAELDGIDHLPAGAQERLASGERVWTDPAPRERHLLVPMRSLGALRGVLDIAPKRHGALFTEEDVSLLDTIAALGAIALHNAEIIAALDRTRRIELDATRDDKKLTLGTLGAELSHEISHPLQFFRGILRRGAKRALDPDDVEIGEEEIARMERMLASMRRLESHPRRVAVALAEPAERAFVLLREVMQTKGVRHALELPPACAVLADPDGLVQVFANLLRNAVQAVPTGGALGVRGAFREDGALVVEVWDDGPGVPEHLIGTLFHRWVTSRSQEGGSGLGLSVAQNIVTSFDWRIEYVREGERSCFRVLVPRDKVVGARPVAT